MNELFKAYFCALSPPRLDHRIQTVAPAAAVTLEFDSTKGPQDLLDPLGCQVTMHFNGFLSNLILGYKFQLSLWSTTERSKSVSGDGFGSKLFYNFLRGQTLKIFLVKKHLIIKFSFHKFMLKAISLHF